MAPRFCLLATLLLASLAHAAEPASPEVRNALARIAPNPLRAHVSFLASDLLEGRGTPSRGLEIAAEYIAAQFRRIGLQPPAGEDGYFQPARFLSLEAEPAGVRLEISGRDAIHASEITINTQAAATLENAAAVKFGPGVAVEGKVAFAHVANARDYFGARRAASQKPALIVLTGPFSSRIVPRETLVPADQPVSRVPILVVANDGLTAAIESAPPGALPFKVSASIPAPVETPLVLRNVAGLLPGSDPTLKDSYIIITAHYDHLGLSSSGPDKINNGANDDASGVASIIEIASALASMPTAPRRSILFVALFGEENGLLGSRYYTRHPLVPLAKTVAGINLEHMGRTDSDLGPHVGLLNVTGFDFSDVTATLKHAGDLTSVQVVKDDKNSDAYFARSDNQALADAGIPAHTISVSYEFPDYHRPSDEADKLDYDNMTRVTRTVALGALLIADNPEPPKWNTADSKTRRYVEAARKLKAAP
jgi:hypothetical protein